MEYSNEMNLCSLENMLDWWEVVLLKSGKVLVCLKVLYSDDASPKLQEVQFTLTGSQASEMSNELGKLAREAVLREKFSNSNKE